MTDTVKSADALLPIQARGYDIDAMIANLKADPKGAELVRAGVTKLYWGLEGGALPTTQALTRITALEADLAASRRATADNFAAATKAEAALAAIWNEADNTGDLDAIKDIARDLRFTPAPQGEAQPVVIKPAKYFSEYVNEAAAAWCGQKDRETFSEDVAYFKHNWSAMPGLWPYVIRAALAHPSPAPKAEPVAGEVIDARTVAEAVANCEGVGNWMSCTGCHELDEGHPTGRYSTALKCYLGLGCTECGGLGAVWDTTDYAAMGDWLAKELVDDVDREIAQAAPAPVAVPLDAHSTLTRRIANGAIRAGWNQATAHVEKILEAYVSEHGNYDPSTGQTEYADDGEWAGNLEEIIDGMREAAPKAGPTPGAQPVAALRLSVERKIGMYGSAFDGLKDARAYTYDHQPSNVPAWQIGKAAAHAARDRRGDYIDAGLALLRHLQDAGFGIFALISNEPTSPAPEAELGATDKRGNITNGPGTRYDVRAADHHHGESSVIPSSGYAPEAGDLISRAAEATNRIDALLSSAQGCDGPVNGVSKKDLRLFAAALRALPAPVSAGTVKPLVWTEGWGGAHGDVPRWGGESVTGLMFGFSAAGLTPTCVSHSDALAEWVAEKKAELEALHADRILSAIETPVSAWQGIDSAPPLDRVIVAGWQPASGRVAGYWWYHEDHTDQNGVPMERPKAELFVSMADVLPAFPAPPTKKGGEA